LPLYFFQVYQHGDLIVISSELGTRQGDPLGRMLFVLAHLHVFHPIAATHATCVFPFLVDDTHIIGPTSNVVLTLEQL